MLASGALPCKSLSRPKPRNSHLPSPVDPLFLLRSLSLSERRIKRTRKSIDPTMKTPNRSFYTLVLAFVLALSFGFRASAEPPREELAHAFYHLKFADHDYAGHRVLAM